MESDLIVQAVQLAVKKWPGILPYLSRKARHLIGDFELKTYEYYLRNLRKMVIGLYKDYLLRTEFVDMMIDLVQGQFTDAYEQAMKDNEVEAMTPEMRAELDNLIASEWEFIAGFSRDIIIARNEGESSDDVLRRAELWANKWNDVYNKATMTIEVMYGGKLKWILGATEEHCVTCKELNGKVAFAKEWLESKFRPQNAPNEELACGGWRCDCSLEHTDERRTHNIKTKFEEIHALTEKDKAGEKSAKYSPDQPRVPAGSSEGGQWTDGGATSINDGESKNEIVGNTAHGEPIYNIVDASNLADYGAIVVHKSTDEILACKTGEYHAEIIETIHADRTVDNYVRFTTLRGELLTNNASASVDMVFTQEDNTRAIDNIYHALDKMVAKGLPKNTIVTIYQGNFGPTIHTTAKSIISNLLLCKKHRE